MKIGIAVRCTTCGLTKKPIGRDAPPGSCGCDMECPGYREPPYPGSLWPGETEEEFGYPIGGDGTREEER